MIASLGRLDRRQKQPHLLIRAFSFLAKEYLHWKVHLYGGNARPHGYDAELRELIRELGLGNQVFLMGITDNPHDILRRCDIFAFPSAFEGWGLALTEAMSVGLPCVGLKTAPAVNELLVDGENGFLSDPTPDDFAAKLKLLMDDPSLRFQMGRVGRESVKQFEPDKIWDQWENLLAETIQEHRESVGKTETELPIVVSAEGGAPDVSIVLPVYNVEPYLRQCLDSVVNQTLRNIQVICVNDGSTDDSLSILEEYAARDSRFKIITQANQGGGSARNAAYPYIHGKYAYFADPDDWLEPDLCEKVSQRLEETEADVVYFRHFDESPEASGVPSPPFNPALPMVRTAPEHRTSLLIRHPQPWRKCWQSEFLLKHHIRFPEGKRPYDDISQHWKGCVLANQIAVLDEPLYHYRRARPDSLFFAFSRRHYSMIETMDSVEAILKKVGKYDDYREVFLLTKLIFVHNVYQDLYHVYTDSPDECRTEYRQLIRDTLCEEERHFIKSAPPQILPQNVWAFYETLQAGDNATQ